MLRQPPCAALRPASVSRVMLRPPGAGAPAAAARRQGAETSDEQNDHRTPRAETAAMPCRSSARSGDACFASGDVDSSAPVAGAPAAGA